MKVYMLYTGYEERPEGVYTQAGKDRKDEELLAQAISNRERSNQRLTQEIIELKELRQPYLTEAEMLLDKEREAKEANHTGHLKECKKQRKVLLRQADKLTYDIKKREELILNSQCMLKAELLSRFCQHHFWEEYYVEGELDTDA